MRFIFSTLQIIIYIITDKENTRESIIATAKILLHIKALPTINTQIEDVNSILNNNNKHPVIDLHPLFLNSDDILEPKFSSDGLHLNKKGYQIWADRISPIIMTLNNK